MDSLAGEAGGRFPGVLARIAVSREDGIDMRATITPSILTFAAMAGASVPLAAQGADDCSAPQAISGTGEFSFNSSAATTGSQGQGFGACFSFQTSGIAHDVWFVWTAPQSGNVRIATCGLTSVDTRIAVYAGSGCPAAEPIACNEDACAYQSRLDFPAFANNVYTIQLGSFPSAPGGVGSFSIEHAPAPPYCLTGVGPDVVLGQILNVFNAPADGGVDALAIGGTACNIGTAPVAWNGSAGTSPVIRQNLFRYSVVDGAGRFEQVGMSWLKHGFFAVQQTFCCQCLAEPGTAWLGAGCSDTYVAGINAAQAYLTPNWEVNAHTGEFPHPASDPPWSGSVARRLRIELADLAPTGGPGSPRYIAEGLYVARDDASAGNQNNNASWRELSVTGGPSDFDFDLLPSSPTHRAQAAIRAWRKIDPEVRYVEVQVPGDGLVIVCWRVTELAGGTWRYEYALYNMNSDRNVGVFSLEVPDDAPVSNVGFHDVGYHSGDGPGDVDFDGADWPSTRAGGAMSWACATQAQDPSANALRWGTLYNFRFDSPRPPSSATAILGLWKTGNPARIAVEVEGPAEIFARFCAGDGSRSPCPCGNDGEPGRGCENSAASGGAALDATGTASTLSDDVVLTASGELPSVVTLFFSGPTEITPIRFGDGLRCTGGDLRRLYVKSSVNGVAIAPAGGDPSITSRMASLGAPIGAGATHLYQAYYRDNLEGFCPDRIGDRFNVTSGVRILWGR